MLATFRHDVVRSCQKADFADLDASFLEHFVSSAGFECFSKFEMAAGKGVGTHAVGREAFCPSKIVDLEAGGGKRRG